MKVYKVNDFIKILNNNGYRKTSNGKGGHVKFVNRHTRKSISIPYGKTELNPALTEGIIKRNNLCIR